MRSGPDFTFIYVKFGPFWTLKQKNIIVTVATLEYNNNIVEEQI